jgi:hypothetical protein
MGEKRNAYTIMVENSEEKRPPGRPRRRKENNIKWVVERYDGVVWIGLIWFRAETNGGLL